MSIKASDFTAAGSTLQNTQEGVGDNTITPNTEVMSARKNFGMSLMPRVGFLVFPKCELFLTAGINLCSYKGTYGTPAGTNSKHQNKTKLSPVAGAGIRYDFTPSVFGTVSYNYAFKTKIYDNNDSGWQDKIHINSQIVKVGIGFKF